MGKKVVLHTGETKSLSGLVATLRRNNSWSNTAYDPATDEEYIYSLSDKADRSLRNLRGGVETNNAPGVYQIELVGYASKTGSYSDAWYRNLAAYLKRRYAPLGVPMVIPYDFKGVNEAYGTRSSTRLSNSEWLAAEGILGHQNVPENTHWDPGAMRTEYLRGLLKPVATPVRVVGSSIRSGEHLEQQDALVSPDGSYMLVLQHDGNLVQYKGGKATWATDTNNIASLALQGDGHLVGYDNRNKPVWATWAYGYVGRSAASLVVQDDGNVVVYSGINKPVWCSWYGRMA